MMPKFFILLVFSFVFLSMMIAGCASSRATHSPVEVDGEKMLLGDLSYQDILENFSEWQEYDQLATVREDLIERLKQIHTPVEIRCYLGTWCSDSREGVPPFVKALQAARNNNIHLTLYGVDRQKDDPQHLGPKNNIERVPTFVILQNGEEIARMVEYPMNETFVEDLLQILGIP